MRQSFNSDSQNDQPEFYTDAVLSPFTRAMLLIGSFGLLSGFALASSLEPDNRGFGTHRQFGLPPCYVRVQTGVPCPGCGLTTSFTHFVRGEFGRAFHANAAGLLLATFCVLCIPWCWLSACTARFWGITSPEDVLFGFLCVLCITSLLNWSFNLLG